MEKSFELRREWMEEQQPFACWLHGAAGSGSKWKEKLLGALGTPQEVYRADKETLEKLVGAERAARLCAARAKDVWKEYEDMRNRGIAFYPFYHPGYPQRLLDIPDRPFGVYVKGEIRDGGPQVAVVGARDCSPYGSYVAEMFARGLAEMGLLVISGMARGIDGIAQKAALDANGNTCAVLGCGVDICYPASNEALYREICSNGAVLSEYPPGTKPQPSLFPPRNRIISGLADALLVVEARRKSGTSITVDMALEQGKEVFVIPGRITDRLSDGCNNLLLQGATIALSPAQVAEEIQTIWEQNGWQRKNGEEMRDGNITEGFQKREKEKNTWAGCAENDCREKSENSRQGVGKTEASHGCEKDCHMQDEEECGQRGENRNGREVGSEIDCVNEGKKDCHLCAEGECEQRAKDRSGCVMGSKIDCSDEEQGDRQGKRKRYRRKDKNGVTLHRDARMAALNELDQALLSLLDFYPISIDRLRTEMQTKDALRSMTLPQTYEKLISLESEGYIKQEGGYISLTQPF